MKASCNKCVFWVPRKSPCGACHRQAPTEISVSTYGFFPSTSPDDWCGEFSPLDFPNTIFEWPTQKTVDKSV